MRVLVSAVDVAADRWAARVVAELRAGGPLEARGLGRQELRRTGLEALASAERLSAVGPLEAITRLPAGAAAVARLGALVLARWPDALLVVDAPALHLPLVRLARRACVPTVYYLPPQAWAWRAQRARRLAGAGVRLATALPFEPEWWRARGVDATFVGHPALDEALPPRRREAGMCAVLPGSRPEEARRHLGPMIEAARMAGLRPVVGLAPAFAGDPLAPGVAGGGLRSGVEAVPGPEAIARAAVALAKSGTVALEAALAGLPTVVAYRLAAASYALARRLVRVDHVALPNLVLGRRAYPELIQREATAARMAGALASIAARDFTGEAAELRERLGPPGAARRVADMVRDAAEG